MSLFSRQSPEGSKIIRDIQTTFFSGLPSTFEGLMARTAEQAEINSRLATVQTACADMAVQSCVESTAAPLDLAALSLADPSRPYTYIPR